jgi:glucokinase
MEFNCDIEHLSDAGGMMAEVIISIDLGGTNVRGARLDRELNILERVQIPTQTADGCESVVERIKSQIRAVWPTDGARVGGIGISAPGPINARTGTIVSPPTLGDCYMVPLEQIVRETFNVPTYLGNDANVAALAEVARGSAQGARDAIFITVSTGIGGGVVSDGRLLLGKDGLAAEVGHMVMLTEDRVSTLEKEAAGPALARQARARIEAGEKTVITDAVKGDLSLITGRIVGEAAAAGDALALAVVQRAGRMLGYGITTLLHLFNPEVVVIGGGVSNLGDLLFAPMNEAIQATAIDRAYWADLKIARAALGDNVSIVGAGALVITQGGVQDVQGAVAKVEREE